MGLESHIYELNVFAKILENVTNIPYLNIIEAFKEYQNYTNTVDIVRNKDKIPLTILDDLLKIYKSKERARRGFLYISRYIIETSTYPLNSQRRLKEAYKKIRKIS